MHLAVAAGEEHVLYLPAGLEFESNARTAPTRTRPRIRACRAPGPAGPTRTRTWRAANDDDDDGDEGGLFVSLPVLGISGSPIRILPAPRRVALFVHRRPWSLFVLL